MHATVNLFGRRCTARSPEMRVMYAGVLGMASSCDGVLQLILDGEVLFWDSSLVFESSSSNFLDTLILGGNRIVPSSEAMTTLKLDLPVPLIPSSPENLEMMKT